MGAAYDPNEGKISADRVREATGRDWDGWLGLLDEAGAAGWSHREIVEHLRAAAADSTTGWWRQSIAVEYERARGLRVVGQAAGGFQVGVSKTVGRSPDEVWDLLAGRTELWLGEGASIELEPGSGFEAPHAGAVGDPADGPDDPGGIVGEVRVAVPGDRLRMTWQPAGWAAPAILQIRITTAASGRTTVTAHMEKLPDEAARKAMRARWRAALADLAAAAK